MERAGALPLLPAFRDRLGWEFVVPEGVLAELAVKHVPTELEAFLEDETARVGRCGGRRAPATTKLLVGLGRGETEAICMVDECEDRTFKGYVILTDDKDARARAGALGMRSLNTRGFLLTANREGLLTPGGAMAALESLEASGYSLKAGARERFMRSLR